MKYEHELSLNMSHVALIFTHVMEGPAAKGRGVGPGLKDRYTINHRFSKILKLIDTFSLI